jgi:hypothetical protein
LSDAATDAVLPPALPSTHATGTGLAGIQGAATRAASTDLGVSGAGAIDAPGGDQDDWLWTALGLTVEVGQDATGRGLHGMVGLALRRNPRRAHLLVSRVLGKHLPVAPADALAAGAALAARVRLAAGVRPAPAGAGAAGGGPLVLGYCETATALGHSVADGLPGSTYLHTTRRSVAGMTSVLELEESHSHAVAHWVLPADAGLLTEPRPLVLVDDELSTGNTALGTIRAFHALAPRPSYTVATLLDARPPAARAAFDELAARLGVPVRVVSLLSATVVVPPDVTERARAVRERHAGAAPAGGLSAPASASASARPARHREAAFLTPAWPAGLPDGARHGWSPTHGALLDATVAGTAAEIAARLVHPGGRTLVLGTEELMYTPMRLGAALAAATGGQVRYQSTTRSPVYPLDVPGYAVRGVLEFPAPDDPGRVSQVYNVAPGRYDDIVVVADDGLDAATATAGAGPTRAELAGLAAALGRCAPVTIVTLPCHVPAVTR